MAQDQQLIRVSVTRSMTLSEVARAAGMPLSTLKNLNAAYLNNRIEATTSAQLMLPAARAQQFSENQRRPIAVGSDRGLPDPDQRVPMHPYTTHRVRTGESLWQIARHYAVSVAQLKRWNGLHGSRLKPGAVLRVSAVE
jgi:membrane-bound lytic murein transglycosylase D